MEPDYLETIASRSLADFLKISLLVLPRFSTVNPSYAEKLTELKNSLKDYFEDSTLERPFLQLVLGPPGAGKSHLLKALVEQLKKDTKESFAFQAVNISEVNDPCEIHKFYENIDQNNEIGVKTVTLFDEVDVKWRDGSAIKHLINPIYDGAYWDGARFRKFGRCAFFFAGSYLQDRDTLVKTQKLLASVDLSKFLLDMYLKMHRQGDDEAVREVQEVLDFCYGQQRWRADVDPRTDTILYLRNLDKIRDFLSRIAGNIFEMIDLSAPLHLTREAFVISGNGPVHPLPRVRGTEIVRLVKKRERETEQFVTFDSPAQPLLEYKNVLLCERLLRVIGLIEKRFGTLLPAGEFTIDRRLLNYLAVVPLINGMRSLEQLISKLERPVAGRSLSSSALGHEELAMIVHNCEEFSDPLEVWHKLVRENPSLVSIMETKGAQEDAPIVVPRS